MFDLRTTSSLLAAALVALLALPCLGQVENPVMKTSAVTAALPSKPKPFQHPLTPVLKFAKAEQEYLQATVNSFTCRLVKRERLEGELQEFQFIDIQMQESTRDPAGNVFPMRVHLHYISPAKLAGRRVLYVEGENDGKMIVRKGGKGRIGNLVIKLNPDSEAAQRESLIPVTEIGFPDMLARQIELIEGDLVADPQAENTKVQHVKGAKINARLCDVIKIEHPRKADGLQFHRAEVFIDNELHAPTRIAAYDWPETDGTEPPLLAEFTYTELKLNPEIADSVFDPAGLSE